MTMINPEAIQFYLSKTEKQAFKDACWRADTSMARELRRFVRAFAVNPPKSDRLYYLTSESIRDSQT